MNHLLIILTIAVCAFAEETTKHKELLNGEGVTTTRKPPRTLDRKSQELAWRSWLQSPESGNPNAPARRITTKSLFITPLVCPKGQRLDRDGCVQTLTVNKEEHERILLEQLNALFTSSPNGETIYDYDEDEPGPLQLSIPIGLEPQIASLQAADPLTQSLAKLQGDKDGKRTEINDELKTELERLKLTNSTFSNFNDSKVSSGENIQTNLLYNTDKPKRDNSVVNSTKTDNGEKEVIYGHFNIDPALFYQINNAETTEQTITSTETEETSTTEYSTTITDFTETEIPTTITTEPTINLKTTTATSAVEDKPVQELHQLKKLGEKSKLDPETDYADMGEAVKLISRYAEVTTDDNYSKEQKQQDAQDESVLGTRTKLQHRRNKHKQVELKGIEINASADLHKKDASYIPYIKSNVYYRYPWTDQNNNLPPPGYPFRHLQDYWHGKNHIGGVYKNIHENPRRHHHSIIVNYKNRDGSYQDHYLGYAGGTGYRRDFHPVNTDLKKLSTRPSGSVDSFSSQSNLYGLLGLRHWFSSEGDAKR